MQTHVYYYILKTITANEITTTANGISTTANRIWTFGLSITAEARADGFAVIVWVCFDRNIDIATSDPLGLST